MSIGSILNPLVGNFCEDTQKNGKGAKTGASPDWRSFYLSQYDSLKGSHMTKVVWLPNETDCSYCEFVAPNTSYCHPFYFCNELTPALQPWDLALQWIVKGPKVEATHPQWLAWSWSQLLISDDSLQCSVKNWTRDIPIWRSCDIMI